MWVLSFWKVVCNLNRIMGNTGTEYSCLNQEENEVDDNKYLKYLWWGWINNFKGFDLKGECKWHAVTVPLLWASLHRIFDERMIYVKLLELQTTPIESLESSFVDSRNVCCLFKRRLWIFMNVSLPHILFYSCCNGISYLQVST